MQQLALWRSTAMLLGLAGICLIRNYTDNGSANPTAPSLARHTRRPGHSTFSRTLLHARAILRLARRRPSLALGLAVAAGTALTTAGATGSVAAHAVEMRSSLAPRALTPAAPLPPDRQATPPAITHTHRFLERLTGNPLRGLASWYGDVWNGKLTASGETFDDEKLTAAHKTLPLGTVVRVTNLDSMRSVIVRINDRGTLAPDRVIDLSTAAARELGMVERGLAHVKLEIIGKV